MEDFLTTVLRFAVLVMKIAFFLLGPFITIWSLNTLFEFDIPMNFDTWCAALWIIFLFSIAARENSDNTR